MSSKRDILLGETCAYGAIGGNSLPFLLKASGVRVVGIDIDPSMVDIAGKHCLDITLNREDFCIENRILHPTDGLGCDAVIITAATSSLDPINFAGTISRKRGYIVVISDTYRF